MALELSVVWSQGQDERETVQNAVANAVDTVIARHPLTLPTSRAHQIAQAHAATLKLDTLYGYLVGEVGPLATAIASSLSDHRDQESAILDR